MSRETKIKAQLTCSSNISNIELMTGSTSKRHRYKRLKRHSRDTHANKCKLVILHIQWVTRVTTDREINSTKVICFKHHSLETGRSHTYTQRHTDTQTHRHTHTHLLMFLWNHRSVRHHRLSLTLLHQPAVVRHDLALGEVKSHLQRNQHRELQRNQLSSVYTETLLQLLLDPPERKNRGRV